MLIQPGGRPVTVNALKPRTLLACLVAEANRPVSIDHLIEEVWGAQPPGSAKANVRTYVAGLRKQLDAPGVRVVRATRAGYLVELATQARDVDVFRALVADGQAARASGDAEAALTTFRQALGTWRGRAMCDVGHGPLLGRHARQLEEERQTLLEHGVEVCLGLGLAEEAAVLLRQIIAERPLHEPAHAALMTALYRCGDTVGALNAYQNVREQLRHELGVDPGPELNRLHRAILNRDPALVTAIPSDQRPPRRVTRWTIGTSVEAPRQLPADVPAFVGRGRQVELVLRELTSSPDTRPAATVITGTGGVGKSALAVHIAHMLSDRFPDGQLYTSLRRAEPSTPVDHLATLTHFLRALGGSVPASDSVEEVAATYRSLLARRRVLIVLDDAEDATQLRPYLPGSAQSVVIATTRRSLAALPAARYVHLDVLEPDEAIRLVATAIGVERAAADPDGMARLVDGCARLPLAIAGAKLVGRPGWDPSDLADLLDDERQRLDALTVADLDLRAAFAAHYGILKQEQAGGAARVFRLLGLLNVPQPDLAAIAAMLDRPASEVRADLEFLVDLGLAETPTVNRYRLPDLLRTYARELCQGTPDAKDLDSALQRALRYYLASAGAAVAVLWPEAPPPLDADRAAGGRSFATMVEALGWLDKERTNLVAVATAHEGRSATAALAAALRRTLHPYLGWHGRLTERQPVTTPPKRRRAPVTVRRNALSARHVLLEEPLPD
ncbi:BTAD domain-containing putative transcriptional regulator [Plantactinospora sp. B5E13]|uniref:AfsR/SARP family transcriptional regulator n=1 Tax=Plantactinospora sp. B5E13 TaxID=3153758 RepID=UPI00325EA23A